MKLHKDLGNISNYTHSSMRYRRISDTFQFTRYVIDIDIPKENPILQSIFLSEIDYDGSIFNRTTKKHRTLLWEATFYTDTKLRLITSYESIFEFFGSLEGIIEYFPGYEITVYHTVEKDKLDSHYTELPEAKYVQITNENNDDYLKFIFNFNGNHP